MARFVVLEHRWEGVHWDLMFEVGGTLKTWAIDRPLVAGVELPARRLADHRVAYLEYEGQVSGGRGTVRRIAQGRYVVLAWESGLVRVRLEETQLAGAAELRAVETGPTETPLSWVLRLRNFD